MATVVDSTAPAYIPRVSEIPGKRLRLLAGIVAVWVMGQAGTLLAGVPPSDLTLEFVVGGLVQPVAVRHAGDQTGRLFILERPGRIRIYDAPSDTLLSQPFLDIDPLVDSVGGEQGLLGLAFHPDFRTNGLFFVNYTRDPGPGLDRTVIARYQVSPINPDLADPDSAVVLMEIEQDFGNHNGGNILFGPDGYLYIGMGDGGSGGDPLARAQDKNQLLGKLLRIDVDGTPPPQPNDLCGLNPNEYGIPPDNPFVGGFGSCDEIWAYGLRNPWRFSFDRITGDLFIGDVGQNTIEEVDFQPAASGGGENYGWSCMEGNLAVDFNPCDGAPLTEPIFDYAHAFGCSITGGYRYRGPIQSLRGTYMMGDYCTGIIWFGESVGTQWVFSQWQDTTLNISAFGEDEIGNVYVADYATNGGIWRFTLPAATGSGEVPDGNGVTTPLVLDRNESGDLVLSWGASCQVGDTDYEVYEGRIRNFQSHSRRLCSTGNATSTVLTPHSGDRYYLIVPTNGNREGSHGKNSFGLERSAGTANCLDHALAGCP